MDSPERKQERELFARWQAEYRPSYPRSHKPKSRPQMAWEAFLAGIEAGRQMAALDMEPEPRAE